MTRSIRQCPGCSKSSSVGALCVECYPRLPRALKVAIIDAQMAPDPGEARYRAAVVRAARWIRQHPDRAGKGV